MKSDFLWVEKYRPKTVQDCILPDSIKNTFQEFVEKGEIPNLLLAGPAGCGKTTIARALCEQLGSDYIVINGSDEGRFLDTVRNQAKNFASTVSLAATGSDPLSQRASFRQIVFVPRRRFSWLRPARARPPR